MKITARLKTIPVTLFQKERREHTSHDAPRPGCPASRHISTRVAAGTLLLAAGEQKTGTSGVREEPPPEPPPLVATPKQEPEL